MIIIGGGEYCSGYMGNGQDYIVGAKLKRTLPPPLSAEQQATIDRLVDYHYSSQNPTSANNSPSGKYDR